MEVSTWAWIAFGAPFLGLLALDLFLHRGGREQSRKWSIVWSLIWIGVGLGFSIYVGLEWGRNAAVDYLGAYLMEKVLSVDNLFVFLVIFQMLKVPQENQRTVLSWGILGALVLRGVFIFLGVAAIERYHWVVYVFGALLLFAAWRTFREDPTGQRENKAVAWLSRHLPVTAKVHGNRFIATEDGRRVVTPLMIAVLGVEMTDVLFAIDSVPAAFSITREPYLVYSSNAFAILGLRSLYAVLAVSLSKMRYLHYGLALVLAFAAVKLMIAEWVEIPAWLSILVIAVTIGAAVAASVKARRDGAAPAVEADAVDARRSR